MTDAIVGGQNRRGSDVPGLECDYFRTGRQRFVEPVQDASYEPL